MQQRYTFLVVIEMCDCVKRIVQETQNIRSTVSTALHAWEEGIDGVLRLVRKMHICPVPPLLNTWLVLVRHCTPSIHGDRYLSMFALLFVSADERFGSSTDVNKVSLSLTRRFASGWRHFARLFEVFNVTFLHSRFSVTCASRRFSKRYVWVTRCDTAYPYANELSVTITCFRCASCSFLIPLVCSLDIVSTVILLPLCQWESQMNRQRTYLTGVSDEVSLRFLNNMFAWWQLTKTLHTSVCRSPCFPSHSNIPHSWNVTFAWLFFNQNRPTDATSSQRIIQGLTNAYRARAVLWSFRRNVDQSSIRALKNQVTTLSNQVEELNGRLAMEATHQIEDVMEDILLTIESEELVCSKHRETPWIISFPSSHPSGFCESTNRC